MTKKNVSRALALAGLTLLAASAASAQTTPRPAYPTQASITVSQPTIAALENAVNQANSAGGTSFIRFTTPGPFVLTRPLNLSRSKRYVFWKAQGTAPVRIDGAFRTPLLATKNGEEGNYQAAPRNQGIEFFNFTIVQCRNFPNRNSGDGRGAQFWPGGGAISTRDANLRLIDCVFLNNRSNWPDSRRGMQSCSEVVSGGAVRANSGSLKVWNCFFQNNSSLTGGAKPEAELMRWSLAL